jgi:hypothetical protein
VVAQRVAQRAALDGMAPEAEAVLMPLPGDVDPFERIVLPGKGPVRGIAADRERIWVARDALYVLAAKGRTVQARREVPDGMLGMCADARSLYVLTRRAVVVLDAASGREQRRVELTFDSPDEPTAIGARGDELLVFWPDAMTAVHRNSGRMRVSRGKRRQAGLVRWVASDGEALWAGGRLGFGTVDVAELRASRVRRAMPEPFGDGVATFVAGRLLLAERGAESQARVAAALVDVDRIDRGEQLTIRLRRGAQGVRFEVGPKPLTSPERLLRELQRIARDPASMVPAPDGKQQRMPVMLVVHPGVTVQQLADAWDLVSKAGFPEVDCRSYNAKLRPTTVEPPPPPPPPKPVRKRR